MTGLRSQKMYNRAIPLEKGHQRSSKKERMEKNKPKAGSLEKIENLKN